MWLHKDIRARSRGILFWGCSLANLLLFVSFPLFRRSPAEAPSAPLICALPSPFLMNPAHISTLLLCSPPAWQTAQRKQGGNVAQQRRPLLPVYFFCCIIQPYVNMSVECNQARHKIITSAYSLKKAEVNGFFVPTFKLKWDRCHLRVLLVERTPIINDPTVWWVEAGQDTQEWKCDDYTSMAFIFQKHYYLVK